MRRPLPAPFPGRAQGRGRGRAPGRPAADVRVQHVDIEASWLGYTARRAAITRPAHRPVPAGPGRPRDLEPRIPRIPRDSQLTAPGSPAYTPPRRRRPPRGWRRTLQTKSSAHLPDDFPDGRAFFIQRVWDLRVPVETAEKTSQTVLTTEDGEAKSSSSKRRRPPGHGAFRFRRSNRSPAGVTPALSAFPSDTTNGPRRTSGSLTSESVLRKGSVGGGFLRCWVLPVL
jgi:hypothetical protein